MSVNTLVELLRRRAAETAGEVGYTYLGEGVRGPQRLSYAELWRRARRLAAVLQARGRPGQRALLLHSAGLEFIVAFFGCLCAGMVPVPAVAPHPRRGIGRLQPLLRDCRPEWLLAEATELAHLEAFREAVPELSAAHWLDSGAPGEDGAPAWSDPAPEPGGLAYLQYTSGSTSEPRGVMVSHDNALHNLALVREGFLITAESITLSWLPHFHDLGLIFGLLSPLYVGVPAFLMSPLSFARRPARWLEAASELRVTHLAAPNFAYDLCVRKVPPPQRAQLDLSRVVFALNGSEPVRAGTLRSFAAAFAPGGFRLSAFASGYGLAEATLMVAVGRSERGPTVLRLDARALTERDEAVLAGGEQRAATADPAVGELDLVGCGCPPPEVQVEIVDPSNGRRLPEGRVGEIWIAGRSTCMGYRGRPDDTLQTFGARVARDEMAGAGGEPAGSPAGQAYLRTGDLGFRWHRELFISGRKKDLIIIDGRNHYPQDIEFTVERCHPSLQATGSAAFSVEGELGELLVVVAEVERGYQPGPEDRRQLEIQDAILQAVAAEHDLRVYRSVLVRRGTLPKSSSGKVRRRACRESFLDGSLAVFA